MPRKNNSLWPQSLLAFIAGAVAPLAFAPLNWWPFGFISIIVLFMLWLHAGRAAAAWYGFLYGLGMFGVGTSWIYISLNTFGGMPPALAGLSVLLLVAAASLYPAAAGFVQGLGLAPRRAIGVRAVVIMPGVWVAFEWLRGWLLSGYPWLTTGYALLDTPLANLAPVGGVYLVGLAAVMSAGVVVALHLGPRVNLPVVLLPVAVWVGAWQLASVSWTQPRGAAISVAIVQNNVPLSLKWEREESARILADYLAQSEQHRDADLVLWPEAAAPDYFDRLPENFHRRLRAHPADFVFGVLTRGDGGRYFNSIIAHSNRAGISAYHKQHLVPFGEFLPLQWLFQPLLKFLNIPMSDFTPWPHPQRPLRAAGNAFAASICYEDAFPHEWRAQVPDSGILVNLSEDSWFGDSLAPHQRLQMARFRALESARPMIRSSNNGLSSVINRRGGIDAVAPQFTRTVLTAEVEPRTGVTPYIRHGDRPALILLAALLVGGWLSARRRMR